MIPARLLLCFVTFSAVLLPGRTRAFGMTTEEFMALPLADLRNSRSGAYQLLVMTSNAAAVNPGSSVAQWNVAAIYYFIGDYYETNREMKKWLYTRTRDHALEAVRLEPGSADARYWLAVGYGKWSEANGILQSLFYADDVVRELTRTVEIRPDFFFGVPWAIRAKAYNFAPGWPLSIGDKEQSYRDIMTAYRYGPGFRFIFQLHAELLLNDGRYAEAKQVAEKGLALAFDPKSPREEERMIYELSRIRDIADGRIVRP